MELKFNLHQSCNTRHTFNLEGQGTFLIPPTCSLSFNNAIFHNTEKTKINHHQQQQQITPLTFSDQAILENELDFPGQKESFVTTQESIIAHALLLLLIAVISLLTKIIHTYALSFKNKHLNSLDPESPPNPQPSAPQYQAPQNPYSVTYRVPNDNINLYPRQSRLFSPSDDNSRWESHA